MNKSDEQFMSEIEEMLKKMDSEIETPASLNSENLLPLIENIEIKEDSAGDKIIYWSRKLALPAVAMLIITLSLPLMLNGGTQSADMAAPEEASANEFASSPTMEVAEEEPAEDFKESTAEAETYSAEILNDDYDSNQVLTKGQNSSFRKVSDINELKDILNEYEMKISPANSDTLNPRTAGNEKGKFKKNYINSINGENETVFASYSDENGNMCVDMLSDNESVQSTLSLPENAIRTDMIYGNKTLYIAYDIKDENHENSIITCLKAYRIKDSKFNPQSSFYQDGRLVNLDNVSDNSYQLLTVKALPKTEIDLIPEEILTPKVYDENKNAEPLEIGKIFIANKLRNLDYVITTDFTFENNKFSTDSFAILGE